MPPVWSNPDSAALHHILRDTRTVAVVGASANPARPSYGVYDYLARRSHYQLFPVNPTITAIGDAQAYPRLADLPVVPDLVDVFRRTEELPTVLAESLALNPRPKYLWLQQGLWNEDLAATAEAAGLQVVMDRCLKVDYAQLIGS